MTGAALFALSVAVYAGIPLLLAIWRTPFQFLLLYTHIAAVLTLGGLLGAVYILPVGGSVTLLAGQVSYGGFMFSTLVTVIAGRDLQVVRNVVLLTIAVDTVVYLIFRVSHAALESRYVRNPLSVDPGVFDQSLRVVIMGGLLIILELLGLLGILELSKRRLGRLPMAPVYVLAFVGILALDGVLFPTLVLRPPALVDFVDAAVQAKLVLAAAYAVPLVVFLAFYHPAVERFEATPLNLRELVSLRRDPVLEQLEEQQAELAVRTEEVGRATATVSRILDAATTTLLVATDPTLRITHFNTGAEELLGISQHDALGRVASMFTDAEELARHAEELGVAPHLKQVIEASVRSGRRHDWNLRTGTGERRVLSLSLTEIRDADRLIGYLFAGEDVTGRLRTEAALTEALRAEHESVTRLEDADRVKDEVVSTISHELRTPIASIQGYSEMLADGDLGELSGVQEEALTKVLRNSARLSSLVDDLLQLDRASSGQLTLRRVPTDLARITREAWDSLQQVARGRDLTLTLHLPGEPVPVFGDPAALERVVLNLGGNAIKFTPDGGSITGSVTVADDCCTLTVADTGIGISEADQRQVLNRFFRSTEAYRLAVPGSGLGLSVVATIVEHHGGRIEIDSTLDEGTAVTVTLPVDRR